MFAQRLRTYLQENAGETDLIISAFPPVHANYVLAKWAKQNNKRLWIDIQDLWPEAWEAVVKPAWFRKILFGSFYRKRRFIFEQANQITAVTSDYLNILGAKLRGKAFHLGIQMLGSPKNSHIPIISNKDPKDIFVIFFGNSTRLPFLQELMEKWSEFPSRFKLICAGNSPLFKDTSVYSPNVISFHNPTEEEKNAILQAGDIGLVIHDPALHTRLPYKTFAYLSGGLKILTHIHGGELEAMIRTHNLGAIFEDRVGDFRKKLDQVAGQVDSQEKERIRSWAEGTFSKEVVYEAFAEFVMDTPTT